jgi:hypothetical protein
VKARNWDERRTWRGGLSALTPAAGALRQAKVLWVREGFAKVTRFGAFRDRGARGIQGERVSGGLFRGWWGAAEDPPASPARVAEASKRRELAADGNA